MGILQPQSFTYGLDDLMKRLGQTAGHGITRTERWQLRFIERLIEQHAFPAPLPLLTGVDLTSAPRRKSRWQQAAVDLWFDERTPPAAREAEDRGARIEGEREMDARASAIGLSIITGRAA